jgi:hypothetical protein
MLFSPPGAIPMADSDHRFGAISVERFHVEV